LICLRDLVILEVSKEMQIAAEYFAKKRMLYEYPRVGYGEYNETHLTNIVSGYIGEFCFLEYVHNYLEEKFGNLTWIISEKLYKEKERELKLDILSTAVEFGKQAGERLGRRCVVSNINYEVRGFYFLPVHRTVMKSAELEVEKAAPLIEAPEPKRDEKTIYIKAQVSYICFEKNNCDLRK